MAKGTRKKKFSNNQLVVFRFGERNLVGNVCDVKQVGKRTFIYDVKGEDGIIYEDLGVDAVMNHTIDTHKTRLFYKKYNIGEDQMPSIEQEDIALDTTYITSSSSEEIAVEPEKPEEENLFTEEDSDPNW